MKFQDIMRRLVFTIIGIVLPLIYSLAQCPMCKAAAESNLKNGGTAAKGLNAGIIYLFLTPYLLVGAIAFIWWWNHRKKKVAAPHL